MATIVLSDLAPAEASTFSLANAEIEVPHETTDPTVISNAVAHPWLQVEVDADDSYVVDDSSTQVAPEDDPLSVFNSVAFDPDEIRKVEEAKIVALGTPTALDAGLDQGEEHFIGPVAVTLAADEAAEEEVESELASDPLPGETPESTPADEPVDDTFTFDNEERN